MLDKRDMAVRKHLNYGNVVATAALFVALGGGAYAATAGPFVAPSGAVNGCVARATGALRVVKPGKRCPKGTVALAFNAKGRRGLTGPQGRPGPTGLAGSNATIGGVSAGGDLSGTYPNPAIARAAVNEVKLAANAVTTSKLADGAVTTSKFGAGAQAPDAGQLGGNPPSHYVQLASSPSPQTLNAFSYFMDTSRTDDYAFGQASLHTSGTPGAFEVCSNSAPPTGSVNFVAYVNGTRTAGTIMNGTCSSAFNPGIGGDFTVTLRRAIVFGVHSGDSTTSKNYVLYGFSAL
jgi:hypothetical protein